MAPSSIAWGASVVCPRAALPDRPRTKGDIYGVAIGVDQRASADAQRSSLSYSVRRDPELPPR